MERKVCAITGASSGIGKALAETFAEKGFALSLCARNYERLQNLQQTLQQRYNIPVQIFKVDVTDKQQCKTWIENTIKHFRRLDVLINNAGISMRALFKDVRLEVLKQLMDTNFWGCVYCTKYALPYLLKSRGSVIGVSSIAGFKGLPGRTGYSASKFAMHGFLESLRIEHLKDGLHVLIACPGFTASEIRKRALTADGSPQGETPLKEQKLMSAEAVAKKIYRAYQKKRRYLVLTLQGQLTVWLNKWFPAFMDHLVYNHFAKEPNSPLRTV